MKLNYILKALSAITFVSVWTFLFNADGGWVSVNKKIGDVCGPEGSQNCIGHDATHTLAGRPNVLCCPTPGGGASTCQNLKKDWAGVYYCPNECVGAIFGAPGTCQ